MFTLNEPTIMVNKSECYHGILQSKYTVTMNVVNKPYNECSISNEF